MEKKSEAQREAEFLHTRMLRAEGKCRDLRQQADAKEQQADIYRAILRGKYGWKGV